MLEYVLYAVAFIAVILIPISAFIFTFILILINAPVSLPAAILRYNESNVTASTSSSQAALFRHTDASLAAWR